jgi:hypothetical protein
MGPFASSCTIKVVGSENEIAGRHGRALELCGSAGVMELLRFLNSILLLTLLAEGFLAGQQLGSPTLSECRQQYNDRNYVSARNCFSQILARDPENPVAREYYRLSNVLALGVTQRGEDATHAPETPEIAVLQELVREALVNNPSVRRAQSYMEASRMPGRADLPIPALEEFSRLGIPFLPPWHSMAGSRPPLRGDAQQRMESLEQSWWQSVWEAQKNEVTALIRKSFFRLLAVRQEFRAHDEHRQRLREHKRLTASQYSQRRASQGDLLEAQREESRGIEELIQLEKEEAVARADLNSLLTRDPGSPLQLPDSKRFVEFSWDLRQLESLSLANRPQLKAARVRVQYVSLFESTEGTQAYHQLLLGAETDGLAVVENKVKREVHEAFAKADNLFRLLRFYQTSLTPQLEMALHSAQSSYRAGEEDYVRLLEIQHKVSANEIQMIHLRREYGVSLAELERVAGAPLPRVKQDATLPF